MHIFHSMNFKPDGWILYFPQFHFAIGIVALMNLALTIAGFALIVSMWFMVRAIYRMHMNTCPCCHRSTMRTVQECTSPGCNFTRIKNPETAPVNNPTPGSLLSST